MSSEEEKQYCTVKCCLCGTDIPGNGARMCRKCLLMNVDVSEGIELQASIQRCKECGKTLTSSKHWVYVERESIEELGLMLKMIKGLKRSELVEARFIWTEPHSRRIVIELDIRKEIDNGFSVVGKTRVTFKETSSGICPDCNRTSTNFTWEALVQIRQHVEHKRTLLWLEQVIIANRRHSESIGVEIVPGGLDFYFFKKNEALQFIEHIKSVVICTQKYSKQYHSADLKNHVAFYRHTYYLDIPPVCKDDLVLLPRVCAPELSIPLVICTKVSTSLNFINPLTLKTAVVNVQQFSKNPFSSLLVTKHLKEFTVLDVQLDNPSLLGSNELYAMADIEVIRNDSTDDSVLVRSHLGLLLKPGDIALGYDLRSMSFNSEEVDKYEDDLPDIVLVSKQKDTEKKPKRKHRKNVFMEVKESEEVNEKEVEAYERDREAFLEEGEELDEIEDYEEVVDSCVCSSKCNIQCKIVITLSKLYFFP